MNEKELSILHKKYSQNSPFPHIILDEVCHRYYLEYILNQFPTPDQMRWKYDNALEKKLALDQMDQFPPLIRTLIREMMEQPFIRFLEGLTGIRGLIPDPSLNGGGIHQITQGGKLDVHADYNYHPVTKLDRRLNVLLYLNQNWDSNWKGSLELWNQTMTQCETQISPKFNRMVIFSTTDKAYHGHPDPLECPPSVTRKSIALYYYTNGRPKEEISPPHSTLFQRRPQDPLDPEIEKFRRHRGIKRQAT